MKTLRIDNIWNFATFNLYNVPAKILYLQKYSTDFFRNRLFHLEDVDGGHLDGKLQVRRYFTFAMARWKLCASTTFEIFPLSTCTLCQLKSYISKGIQPIFVNLCLSSKMLTAAFEWKVSGSEVFYFCNGKVKTLRIDKHLKFSHFQPVHCACKNPISPKVFNRFSKSYFQLAKMFRVGIWVESLRCAGILLLQWQGENFAHRKHLKFSHFQPVECAS